MSGVSTTSSATQPGDVSRTQWLVRRAGGGDIDQVVDAVSGLLVELGGTPPARAPMLAATRALVEDEGTGAILVAEADRTLIGVLAASWQTAIHVAGRYALIQDLWVAPRWRSQAIGAALLELLDTLLVELEIERVEVGLPSEGFAALAATTAFYRREGFGALGPRMRRLLR